MIIKEKGRPAEGSPIPIYVLPDNAEYKATQLQLQIIRLMRRCAIKASIAETLAPMVFGERAA